jgi:4-amino-4-deoxy-L-arabinose transferase-like glycosyltransferase
MGDLVRQTLRRTGTAARTHWLFLIVLTLGAAGRVLTMIAYQPVLMYIDSYRYLGNVYTLNPRSMDPIGYPIFLRLVLWFGSLAVVAAIQHLLGLGMGVCIYVLLRRRDVPKPLAALAGAPVLLDAYQWQIEQNVLSDSLFLAMVTAAMTVLAWRRQPSTKPAATAGLILGLAVTVRLVGEVTIFPALLFVALAAGPTWRRKLKVCGVLALAFVLPATSYVIYAHEATGASYSQSQNDNALLYGRAATFANCSALPAIYQSICPPGTLAAREAQGPDYYANAAPYPVPTVLMHPFAWYVIEHQPGDFLYAVGRDFLQLFVSPRETVYGGTDITRWQFQTTYPVWSNKPDVAQDELRAFGETGPTVNAGAARVLIDYQQNGGYTPSWLFAAFLLLGLAGALGLTRSARRSRHRLACLLWTTSGVGLLLIADLFEFSWRYQLPALVFLPAGGVLGLRALLDPDKPLRLPAIAHRSSQPTQRELV